jgi:hypothetical protein
MIRNHLHSRPPTPSLRLTPIVEHILKRSRFYPLRISRDWHGFDSEGNRIRLSRGVRVFFDYDKVVVLAQKAYNFGPCVCVSWVQDAVIG